MTWNRIWDLKVATLYEVIARHILISTLKVVLKRYVVILKLWKTIRMFNKWKKKTVRCMFGNLTICRYNLYERLMTK